MDGITPIILSGLNGMRVELVAHGAAIARILVPDRYGNLVNIAIGPRELNDLLDQGSGLAPWCMGSSIGPFAGRISRGGFKLGDKTYNIPSENGICLHSGQSGWQNRIWEVMDISAGDSASVTFELSCNSEGEYFPGDYTAQVKYTLTNNDLMIAYRVTTAETMIINPTNHVYFNPGGSRSLLGCQLYISGSSIIETDENLVPSGRILPVIGTDYDYTKARAFDGQMPLDTCYAVDHGQVAARIYSPVTGISIEALSNQPGLVVFTPENLNGLPLIDQMETVEFPAICLECQNYPDAPNQEGFPSSVLNPGQVFLSEITYRFRSE